MKSNLKELQEILDYSFKNIDLLKLSLIHKSFNNENNKHKLRFKTNP